MEAESVPRFVYKMRHWFSKSRSARGYAPVATENDSLPGPSLFLQLPSEIRNMIYRELLLDTYPLIVHLRRVHIFDVGKKPYPAILRTNKQVHDEAAAILYGENTWFSLAPGKFFPWGEELYSGESSTYVAEPGPINMYLPWIKRFVLFPDGPPDWIRDKIVKPGDVDTMLKRMGIQRHILIQLVVGVLSQELCDEIVDANQDWLESVDETEMQERFNWFKQRRTQQAFWLVMKEQEQKPPLS